MQNVFYLCVCVKTLCCAVFKNQAHKRSRAGLPHLCPTSPAVADLGSLAHYQRPVHHFFHVTPQIKFSMAGWPFDIRVALYILVYIPKSFVVDFFAHRHDSIFIWRCFSVAYRPIPARSPRTEFPLPGTRHRGRPRPRLPKPQVPRRLEMVAAQADPPSAIHNSGQTSKHALDTSFPDFMIIPLGLCCMLFVFLIVCIWFNKFSNQ